MAAFELAAEQGADALEFDVRLTADGRAVVLHDPTLERTTDRRGTVADLSTDAILEADAGARFSLDGGRTYPWRGRGVRIPLLTEVLSRFPRLPLLIEIKDVHAQEAVRDSILAHQAVDRCVVASEPAEALERLRETPLVLGATARDIFQLYLASWLGRAPRSVAYRLLAVPFRHHGLPVPTRRFVILAHRLRCPVHVWTVNDAARARQLWNRGANGMVTNYPAALRGARDQA